MFLIFLFSLPINWMGRHKACPYWGVAGRPVGLLRLGRHKACPYWGASGRPVGLLRLGRHKACPYSNV